MSTALDKIKQRQQDKKAHASKSADTTAPPTGSEIAYDFFKVKMGTNKQGDKYFESVQIRQNKFLDLLKRLGFRRFTTGDKFVIVRISDNIIEEVSLPDLRLFIKEYFEDLPDDLEEITGCPKEELLEKLTRSLGNLLSDDKLSLLINKGDPDLNSLIVRDTLDESFHFYQNGWVSVSKSGVTLRPYGELKGYVWKEQIIQRPFVKLTPAEYEASQWWEFLNNVADNWKRPDGERNNPGRFSSLLTLLGYNMHRFYAHGVKITIFLDARKSDEADGRSGKTLMCKALRHIYNPLGKEGLGCKFINGKDFDPNNRFKYEKIHDKTRLVVFDDVKQGFDIRQLFVAVEEGIEKELKNGGRSDIMAKIIVTLNYVLNIQGGSAHDRVYEFEAADFYSDRKKPQDVHQERFFEGWGEADWLKFDNIMMSCLCDYFTCGVLEAETINLHARKLKQLTSEQFIQFMEELPDLEHEKRFSKKQLYEDFTQNEQRKEVMFKGFSQRMFTNFLRYWAEYRPEWAGYREQRSDKTDYIMFFKNAPVTAEFLDDTAASVKVRLFEGKSELCTPLAAQEGGGEKSPF